MESYEPAMQVLRILSCVLEVRSRGILNKAKVWTSWRWKLSEAGN